MKRLAILSASIIVCLITAAPAYGQKGCEFNIVGTWRAESPDGTGPALYRFGPDAIFTELSDAGSGRNSELREIASATYTLDNPMAPKIISFKASNWGNGGNGGKFLVGGVTSMEIIKYDETSFTCARPGYEPTRWVRVEPHRYFMVLAGRSGAFYDRSGPTFPMLVRIDRKQTQVDAVGIYSAGGKRAFGTIPAATIKEFMKEPRKASDVMLRLEITGAQYERGLKIVRSWERRAREGDLLYPDVNMDNILLVKQVTESLNQCGERVKLYKLDWGLNDTITEHNLPSRTPFLYFKELRRLNEPLHVRDEQFHQWQSVFSRQ